MLRCNVLVEGGRVRAGGDRGGESERWKETAEEVRVRDGRRQQRRRGARERARRSFLGRAPEALHIPARLIEAVSVFVFSACELTPDYRGAAVHPRPPDRVTVHRVTTETNAGAAATPPPCSFHFTSCHSFTSALTNQHQTQ